MVDGPQHSPGNQLRLVDRRHGLRVAGQPGQHPGELRSVDRRHLDEGDVHLGAFVQQLAAHRFGETVDSVFRQRGPTGLLDIACRTTQSGFAAASLPRLRLRHHGGAGKDEARRLAVPLLGGLVQATRYQMQGVPVLGHVGVLVAVESALGQFGVDEFSHRHPRFVVLRQHDVTAANAVIADNDLSKRPCATLRSM